MPQHLAEDIDRQVASGDFTDPSDVIAHALEHAVRIDPVIEHWLRTEVLPTIERIERDGPANLTSELVFGGLRERYLARDAS
ncbi:hypothetical protein BZG35_12175 [Brevundimonas sp. LM2]|uniref:ribbon-helix-helix domain-containing protein n=1 Tax=Brevundimonas sp. LM2 TaxID=1938605 RepID=UPI000983BFA2|nr:hypothetical protein [Brevundimonas sp. LM2]AQR62317.1 hypothetical protein BZG35_12175 [Brevundimonas sp. LM2]